MDNDKVIEILKKISYQLRQDGETWKANAYTKAAETVKACDIALKDIPDLTILASIGKGIASIIEEILRTGESHKLNELELGKPPYSIREMEKIPGIGLKTAIALWNDYRIDSLDSLEAFVKKITFYECFGYVQDLPSQEDCKMGCEFYEFCKNADTKWLKYAKGIEFARSSVQRMLHYEGFLIASEYMEKIISNPKLSSVIEKWSFAGSLRRFEYTIKDMDILICVKEGREKAKRKIAEVVGSTYNKNKIPVIVDTPTGPRKLDINFATPATWATYLNYFTGSRDFNIALRSLALKQGITINEHRLEATKTITIKRGINVSYFKGDKIPCHGEGDLFEILNIPYVPPECRVDGTEIGKDLSDLIELDDIAGDVHCHSTYSDGELHPIKLFEKAEKQGFDFIGISDHTTAVGITGGMDKKEMIKMAKNIKGLNFNIPVYVGAEVDVNTKGEIDNFEALYHLDYVIIACHIKPEKDITKRFINAMKAIKKPKILAHPTGRLYGQREEADADWDAIFKVAYQTKTAIEINSIAARRDLPFDLIRKAKMYDVKFFITSDFHGGDKFNLEYGIKTARKGLIEKHEVVNTSLISFLNWLSISKVGKRKGNIIDV